MLKPHAPKLIPALLESLSVLEPQVLNYLSLRATDQEKVTAATVRHIEDLQHPLDSRIWHQLLNVVKNRDA